MSRLRSGQRRGIAVSATAAADQVEGDPDAQEVPEAVAACAVDDEMGLVADGEREGAGRGDRHTSSRKAMRIDAELACGGESAIGNMIATAALWWSVSAIKRQRRVDRRRASPSGRGSPTLVDQSRGDEARGAGLVHRVGDTRAASDRDQDGPVDGLARLGRRDDNALAIRAADRDEGGDRDVDPAEARRPAPSRPGSRARCPRSLEGRLPRPRELAREIEVAAVAMEAHELGRALHEQRVAGAQLDVADLAGDALGVAVDRDHDGVVDRPEIRSP